MSDTLNFVLAHPNDAAARIEALEDRINELEQAKQDAGEAMEIYVERIEALEAALRERDEKLVIYHAFLSEAFPNGAKLNFSVDDLEKARAALAPESK